MKLIGSIFILAAVSSLYNGQKVQFTDITVAAGIQWTHNNGMSANHYLPETVGGGCAFLDYDQDGWMDIYLVNSGESSFFKPSTPLRNALYHNNHDGTFTDVTEIAGVAGRGFGMGVAVGDYDGDGYPDMLVTGFEYSILYHNERNGTFKDMTAQSGINTPGWSTSATWFDYDNDGRLDLFVCQFVHWTPELNAYCRKLDKLGYCIPRLFPGRPAWLFHNNGDGTFTEVGEKAGIANPGGKGLGVVAADINNDGWIDIFQANDTEANYLYKNKKDGTFEDIGLFAGVAYSREGNPRSGMGVDAQDFNSDGFLDLFVANVDHELFSLYRNTGREKFEDEGINNTEMSSATYNMSGWGLHFLDYDNDGELDLILLNEHPDDRISTYRSKV
ncbi:MAG TPA: VCBS repeat-containing protein, partial [Acidobacteriota bacterium]|nr:VCBS repeat-containing protein [Acidobacteriota bacterium]